MRKVLWIGIAGAAGALLRMGIGQVVMNESGFPLATLIVNLIGTFSLCFIVTGVLLKLSVKKDIQDVVTTGFLGSFTTFSSLSIETIMLVESGQIILSIIYVGLSMIGGITTGLLGYSVGRRLLRV